MAIYVPGSFFSPEITNPGFVSAPTVVVKSGTGSADYSTNSATYVDVDATNLAYTVTPPTASKLLFLVFAQLFNDNGGDSYLGLFDSVSNSILGQSIAVTNANLLNVTFPGAFAVLVVGDNLSHTFKLQFHQGRAGHALLKNSGSIIPQMVIFTTGIA